MKNQYYNTFGPTMCGKILHEKIYDNKKLYKKIANFFEVTMQDYKILISKFKIRNQANRVRIVYLLGRFQQLEEFAKTNCLETDIVKRLKYIIKFQTRN